MGIKYAVTGGIGSGKSTVCAIIKRHGYPVFSCDEIYTELTLNMDFCKQIADITGVALIEDGGRMMLNRSEISKKIFTSAEMKQRLENFTHPAIMAELFVRMDECTVSFAEVPLLFENKLEKLFDGVIVVLRDENDRISSLKTDRGMSENQVLERIKNQFDYEKLNKEEHTVIYNSSNLKELERSVELLLSEIIK